MSGLRRALTAACIGVVGSQGVATAAPLRHALVIGTNDGGAQVASLAFAESDADAMATLLAEIGGFEANRISVLLDPTVSELDSALDRHQRLSEQHEDDLYLVYFAGPASPKGLRLGREQIAYETVRARLRSTPAETRVALLDLCYATPSALEHGIQATDRLFGDAHAEEAWLTASTRCAAGRESRSLQGGVYAHTLRSGLRGAADLDDSAIDLDALERYLRASEPGTDPTHDIARSGRDPGLPITDVRNAQALLTLPATEDGRISVRRISDGQPMVTLATPTPTARLALPPGAYQIRRELNEHRFEVSVRLEADQSHGVEAWGSEVTARPDPITRNPAAPSWLPRDGGPDRAPALAALAGLTAPGAGQLYTGRAWRGLGTFAATTALLAGALTDPVDEIDPAMTALLGGALWGASLADAVYRAPNQGEDRPIGGAQISLEGTSGVDQWRWPRHIGLSADVVFLESAADRPTSLSLGLDRVGYTPYDGGWDAHVGSRILVGWEGRRLRPAAVAAVGLRQGDLPRGTARMTRAVIGFGGQLRYYAVPRYFGTVEARWERDGDQNGLRSGVGFGVHLGR